jgi:hypothetical protein
MSSFTSPRSIANIRKQRKEILLDPTLTNTQRRNLGALHMQLGKVYALVVRVARRHTART